MAEYKITLLSRPPDLFCPECLDVLCRETDPERRVTRYTHSTSVRRKCHNAGKAYEIHFPEVEVSVVQMGEVEVKP